MAMIKVDYDKSRRAARNLLSQAEELKTLCTTLSSHMNNTASSWQGESARAFSALVDEWVRKTRAEIDRLEALSAQITRVANELEAAENKIIADVAGFADKLFGK